jgi:hypothetical protein
LCRSQAIISGSFLYGGGWLVQGSSGGKNAAYRRTMEIIEENKPYFAALRLVRLFLIFIFSRFGAETPLFIIHIKLLFFQKFFYQKNILVKNSYKL